MKRALKWAGLAVLFWLVGIFIWVWIGPEELPNQKAETAIVLGAGVDDDVPSPVFAARIDHAITLLRGGRVERIIFTGGKGMGDSLSEAEAAREYALKNGVVAGDILVETKSRTTMENLAFAQPRNLGHESGSILVVSDPLHLRRAMLMADDLGYDAYPTATPTTRFCSLSTRIPFALSELYYVHHYWALAE